MQHLNEDDFKTSEKRLDDIAHRVAEVAEAMAFDEAADEKSSVSDDMIVKHIDHTLGLVKKLAVKVVEKNREKK